MRTRSFCGKNLFFSPVDSIVDSESVRGVITVEFAAGFPLNVGFPLEGLETLTDFFFVFKFGEGIAFSCFSCVHREQNFYKDTPTLLFMA